MQKKRLLKLRLLWRGQLRLRRLQLAARDLPSYLFLARHGRWRELRNFQFTRWNLPVGEGCFLGRDARRIRNPDNRLRWQNPI